MSKVTLVMSVLSFMICGSAAIIMVAYMMAKDSYTLGHYIVRYKNDTINEVTFINKICGSPNITLTDYEINTTPNTIALPVTTAIIYCIYAAINICLMIFSHLENVIGEKNILRFSLSFLVILFMNVSHVFSYVGRTVVGYVTLYNHTDYFVSSFDHMLYILSQSNNAVLTIHCIPNPVYDDMAFGIFLLVLLSLLEAHNCMIAL